METILALALTSHLGLAGDYNEINPSIQLRFDEGFVAGAHYNSESTVSLYAGFRGEYQDFFYEVGVVTGYENADVMPYGRVGYDLGDNYSVFVAPAIEVDAYDNYTVGAVIGLEFYF